MQKPENGLYITFILICSFSSSHVNKEIQINCENLFTSGYVYKLVCI